MTVEVDRPDPFQLEEPQQRSLGFRGPILPQPVPDSIPGRGEAFLVGVGVLDDQPLEPLGMAAQDPESQRTAVVLDVEPEPGDFELSNQPSITSASRSKV